MNLDLKTMLQKHAACVSALGSSKRCETCAYKNTEATMLPCRECMGELLGMPVNPTKWETKP